jgi:hypothetical protein
MGIKKLSPTSPARRYQTYLTRDELTPNAEPERSLLEPKTRISGRNNNGHITMRRRGGGHKRFYRIIDFKRDKAGIPGRISQIEYDPNRSAHIALITYLDGEKRYIIAPAGIEVGKMIMSGPEADILPGNALPIRNIPLERRFTTSKCVPARAHRWHAPQAHSRNSSLKKATTRNSVCLRAKSAACLSCAWRQSGRSEIRSTKTSVWVKPDARVGRVCDRKFAASP